MVTTWSDYKQWLGEDLLHYPQGVKAPSPTVINRDSRAMSLGDWYLALSGENFDGHSFIKGALDAGAAGFIYSDEEYGRQFRNGIHVKDTLLALQKIAAGYRRTIKTCKRIAITGSVGKTTVKQMLNCILSQTGKTIASPASYNNEIGVPLSLLMIRREHKYGVFECGARRQGDIDLLTRLIEPHVAVVLNARGVHLSEFGNIETVLATKTEMYRASRKDSVLIAPADQQEVVDLAIATGKGTLTFGTARNADIAVSNQQWLKDGSLQFALTVRGETIEITIPKGHESYGINAAAAAAAAIGLNINLATIAKGLATFEPGKGRFQTHQINPNFYLVDDSYNASPSSMKSGFRSLSKLFPETDKVVVLGDMLELGAQSDQLHESIGEDCVKVLNPTFFVAVGSSAASYLQGAYHAGLPEDRSKSFAAIDQVLDTPLQVSKEKQVVYIKGSNGVGLGRLVEALLAGKA